MSAVSFKNVDPGFTTVNAEGSPALVIAVILIKASFCPPINV